MEPTSKMWIYIGIGFAVFVGVVVFYVLSKRLKSLLGHRNTSNSKEYTKGGKNYNWKPIRKNLPTSGSKTVDESEEEDSDDQEPINPVEKTKILKASRDSEESEEE